MTGTPTILATPLSEPTSVVRRIESDAASAFFLGFFAIPGPPAIIFANFAKSCNLAIAFIANLAIIVLSRLGHRADFNQTYKCRSSQFWRTYKSR